MEHPLPCNCRHPEPLHEPSEVAVKRRAEEGQTVRGRYPRLRALCPSGSTPPLCGHSSRHYATRPESRGPRKSGWNMGTSRTGVLPAAHDAAHGLVGGRVLWGHLFGLQALAAEITSDTLCIFRVAVKRFLTQKRLQICVKHAPRSSPARDHTGTPPTRSLDRASWGGTLNVADHNHHPATPRHRQHEAHRPSPLGRNTTTIDGNGALFWPSPNLSRPLTNRSSMPGRSECFSASHRCSWNQRVSVLAGISITVSAPRVRSSAAFATNSRHRL